MCTTTAHPSRFANSLVLPQIALFRAPSQDQVWVCLSRACRRVLLWWSTSAHQITPKPRPRREPTFRAPKIGSCDTTVVHGGDGVHVQPHARSRRCQFRGHCDDRIDEESPSQGITAPAGGLGTSSSAAADGTAPQTAGQPVGHGWSAASQGRVEAPRRGRGHHKFAFNVSGVENQSHTIAAAPIGRLRQGIASVSASL